MIGTFIRSTHHLSNCGEYSQPIDVIGIRHNNAIKGKIVKVKSKKGTDIFFFFQHVNGNVDLMRALQHCDKESEPIITKLFNEGKRCVLLFSLDELRNYGTQFLMLPKNFDELYSTFVQQNKKVLNPIFSKYLYVDDDMSKVLFAFCESANFFVWAAKNVRGNHIALMTIYRIMMWNHDYSQLVSKLKKGTITAYNNTYSVLDLLKECQELRKTKRANDIINLFNTEQKKLLKANFDTLPIETLSKFAILSKTKQQNFIRKVSTLTDLSEILRLMSFTTSEHFAWNKESLLEYIKNVEGLNCEVTLVNDTSVLVEVKDFETVKKLAKTTNWCISKNKSYWNNYMGKRDGSSQYIIFDFSKKEDDELSIVGFTTVANKGITHAHSFTNVDLMEKSSHGGDNRPYANLLKSDNVRQGIYTVISNNKIPLSLVTKFRSRFPIWSKEAFLEVFNKYVSPENYTIYYDDNNQLVISTRDFNGIFNLFGDSYNQKFMDCYRNCEHILFLDFNKNATDNDKLKFTIISGCSYNNAYKSPLNIWNEYSIQTEDSFNDIIEKMGIPYNIICRPNTVKHRFLEAISTHSLSEMEKYIDDEQIKHLLMSKASNEVKNLFKNELYASITSYFSIDLLDMIEKHGYSLEHFFNYQNIQSLARHFYGDAACCGGANYYQDSSKFNADKLYDGLINNTLNDLNPHQKAYIARCYMFERMIKPYKDNPKALKVIINSIIERLPDYHYGGYITEVVMDLALTYLDKNALSSELANILSTIFNNNNKTFIEKFLTADITNEDVRKLILSYATTKYQKEFKRLWGMKDEKPKEEKGITWSSLGGEPMFTSFTYSISDPWGGTITASN